MAVALQSKPYVCVRLLAGIVGSNPSGSIDVRLLCLLCVLHVAAFVTG